ncbi:MAG: metallophosphoesterase [Bacteroidetes bacterium]|nr:metallophosphoesterase [Bacteroidota bacterium]
MPRNLFPYILTTIFILLDVYIYSGIRFLLRDMEPRTATLLRMAYWVFVIGILIAFWYIMLNYTVRNPRFSDKVLLSAIFITFLVQLIGSLFLGVDDLLRGVQWVIGLFQKPDTATTATGISRKSFLVKSGFLMAASFGVAMTYGVVRGSHRYQVRRQKLRLKNLPEAFVGMKILQISDIHSGSFWNKEAVAKGIERIKREKADVVFFTGDIVNNEASEMEDYIDLFSQITAPEGVFSILGNHDYGEYLPNHTPDKLPENIARIEDVHKQLGWDLLRNENRILDRKGQKLAIIGVENWSNRMHFSRYGDLDKAYIGTEETPTRLLLSHDPSHWRAEVIERFKGIQATFSGHTHGMQFGIETAGFKWSPVKLAYPEWAGLYSEDDQHLYVNRGFGYLGFPGRLGIWPEITVFELESA